MDMDSNQPIPISRRFVTNKTPHRGHQNITLSRKTQINLFYCSLIRNFAQLIARKGHRIMTREEMIERGLVPEETKHNGHRRAHFHDYNRPGIYMITLVTEGRQRLFGSIAGHTRGQRGTEEFPHLQCSTLGTTILQEEIAKIPYYYKEVEVMKVALMPDHIHLLVNVKRKLPEGKHLGNIVRGFKTGCTRAWWKLQDEVSGGQPNRERPSEGQPSEGQPSGGQPSEGQPSEGQPSGGQPSGGQPSGGQPSGKTLGTVGAPSTVPEASPSGSNGRTTARNEGTAGQWQLRPVLFQSGYHDRIIIRDGMLENICRYMDENPFRARLREEYPNLMQRCLHLWIHDREYAAFGNLFLLKDPNKLQVFFHRKNPQGVPTHLTPEYAKEKERLLQQAEEGAVLVTPGISKGEQGVVDAALADHLPLILLQKEPITEYWKPPQRRFYACAAGRLLILSPWKLECDSDYARFHSLNDMARDICLATDTRLLGMCTFYKED
jgi:hypothetical protein